MVPSSGEQANAHFRNLLVSIWNVNIKVAVAKCLLKHYFDAEYTIRQLPTANQHAKDGFCGKITGRGDQGKLSLFSIKPTKKPMYQQIRENEYCIYIYDIRSIYTSLSPI